MIELAGASPPSAAAAGEKPASGNLLRSGLAAAAAPGTAATPFRDALALELELLPEGFDPALPALPAAAAAQSGGLAPGEEALPAGDANTEAMQMVLGLICALPPQITPRAPAPAPAQSPAELSLALLGASSAAPTSAGGADLRLRAPTAGASTDAAQSPLAARAADLALADNTAAAAQGALRAESAFALRLQERHRDAPAPTAAIANAAPAAADPPAPAHVAALEAHVGARGWDQGLGERLLWMAGQKQQVAQLHLNPPDLGPLQITLTLEDDQASAQFVCAHATVREAIETAMPRLREMLADNGITLGNASVGSDAFYEQAQPQHEARAFAPEPAAADSGAAPRGERVLPSARGLVDTFA